jgi:hypothetical protein
MEWIPPAVLPSAKAGKLILYAICVYTNGSWGGPLIGKDDQLAIFDTQQQCEAQLPQYSRDHANQAPTQGQPRCLSYVASPVIWTLYNGRHSAGPFTSSAECELYAAKYGIKDGHCEPETN